MLLVPFILKDNRAGERKMWLLAITTLTAAELTLLGGFFPSHALFESFLRKERITSVHLLVILLTFTTKSIAHMTSGNI